MLKTFKRATLQISKALGVFRVAAHSRWRRRRLLILAYHGISQRDEHLWNPELFMRPDHFEERMRILERSGCTVLPLAEALASLATDDLPEKAVALTFDDGFYNFYERAFPILQKHDFPATLYLTTYYSFYNKPVFDVISAFVIWKGRRRILAAEELTGQPGVFDLSMEGGRATAVKAIRDFARQKHLSASEKETLVAALAKHLGVDYESILSERILHLLNPTEVTALAKQGVDFQLHTHRHRTPRDRHLFLREIEDNKKAIASLTGSMAAHFCYPSGVYHSQFLPWLRDAGVYSATTCDPGLATHETDQLLLPRLVDTSLLSPIEFEGWLTGVSSIFPRRTSISELR